MNGTELFDTIRDVADRALYHRCSQSCDGFRQARGNPPPGYWEKAVRLFGRYGYRLRRGWAGEGCDGTTIGPMSDEEPCTVIILRGMSPAREYAVLAHEFGHVLLAHSPRNGAEMEREMYVRTARAMFRGEPVSENFDSEVSCELASVACVKAAGLPAHPYQQCYLGSRMREYRRRVDEKCLWAAHLAASTFSAAMLPDTVGVAA